MRRILLIATCYCFFTSVMLSQESDDSKSKVYLKSEEQLIGSILEDREGHIKFLSLSLDTLLIDKSLISKISSARFNDPRMFTDHYFVNPTSFAIPKGALIYKNSWLFFNTIAYGISDKLTAKFNFEIINIIADYEFPWIYGSLKYELFKHNGKALGISANYMLFEGSEHVFYPSIIGTLGNSRTNLSISVGYGRSNESLRDVASEIFPISISGMLKISDRISLVTENFTFREQTFRISRTRRIYVTSLGMKYFSSDNGLSFSLGLMSWFDDDLPVYPYASVNIPIISK